MPIPFQCSHCGQESLIEDKRRGCRIECPSCGMTGWVFLEEPQKKAVTAKKIWSVLGLLFCLVLLILLLLPADETAREAARRMQCSNNIKQFGLAMHNYHDEHKLFPPASGPIVSADDESVDSPEAYDWSWRVRILPYIEQQELYDRFRFDEPWFSDHNLAVAETMPDDFKCFKDEEGFKQINGRTVQLTNYVMITGPNTIGSTDGVPVTFSDISDGSSNTLLIVEVTGDYRPAWTEPIDISITDLRRNINAIHGKSIGSQHPGGANVGLADGSVRYISESIGSEVVQRLAIINDGEFVAL